MLLHLDKHAHTHIQKKGMRKRSILHQNDKHLSAVHNATESYLNHLKKKEKKKEGMRTSYKPGSESN